MQSGKQIKTKPTKKRNKSYKKHCFQSNLGHIALFHNSSYFTFYFNQVHKTSNQVINLEKKYILHVIESISSGNKKCKSQWLSHNCQVFFFHFFISLLNQLVKTMRDDWLYELNCKSISKKRNMTYLKKRQWNYCCCGYNCSNRQTKCLLKN